VISRFAMMAVAATALSYSALALPTAASAADRETAAVSWSPGTHLRVYISDGGNIIERAWDGSGGWYTGAFKQAGQSASATAWADPVLHIRVYVTNGASITEYCWDDKGPWYKGAFTP
jgi:hypothetical protein